MRKLNIATSPPFSTVDIKKYSIKGCDIVRLFIGILIININCYMPMVIHVLHRQDYKAFKLLGYSNIFFYQYSCFFF